MICTFQNAPLMEALLSECEEALEKIACSYHMEGCFIDEGDSSLEMCDYKISREALNKIKAWREKG